MNLNDVKKLIEEQQVESIDLKYADLVGNWYHITFPVRRLDHVMHNGIPFDGSSVPGMRSVEAGDMLLIPDPATAVMDPFAKSPTTSHAEYICDADTRRGVAKDPRTWPGARNASWSRFGYCGHSLWVPEFEFYLFNEAEINNGKFSAGYKFTSAENKDDLPCGYLDRDGTAVANRKGYHIDIPFDKYAEVREEMVRLVEGIGCPVRYHHHEVGLSGQQEIETELVDFRLIIDRMMYIKDIIHNMALRHGLTRDLHAQAAVRRAGQRHALPHPAPQGGPQRFLRAGRLRRPVRRGAMVHRRHPDPRTFTGGVHQPEHQLLQAAAARFRGAGEAVFRPGQPQRGHSHSQVRHQ